MSRKSRNSIAIVLVIMMVMPWLFLVQSPGVRALRSVDLCLIIASGMALGALVAHFARRLRQPSE